MTSVIGTEQIFKKKLEDANGIIHDDIVAIAIGSIYHKASSVS